MKQILFPTAYSKQSKAAYRYAQKLAQYFEAKITLVHVYQSPTIALASGATVNNEAKNRDLEKFSADLSVRKLEELKSFAAEMSAKQFHSIPLDYIVVDGLLIHQLLKIQQQNKPDLVVMGMRRHDTSERIFGNNVYKLIDKLACPLLLIPPGARYLGLNKLVYSTAFEVGDKDSIDYLMDWCSAFDGNLHLAHVHKLGNQEKASQQMDLLLQNFKEELEGGIITKRLLEGEVSKALTEYMDLTGSGILAIHKRKKGFWLRLTEGSLTKVLAEKIKIPLLVLKAKESGVNKKSDIRLVSK